MESWRWEWNRGFSNGPNGFLGAPCLRGYPPLTWLLLTSAWTQHTGGTNSSATHTPAHCNAVCSAIAVLFIHSACTAHTPSSRDSFYLCAWRVLSEHFHRKPQFPTNVSTPNRPAETYFAKISMLRGFADNCYLSPRRPLIPVSKLTVSEPYENYMSRSYQVTKDILSDCRNSGKSAAAELLGLIE